MLSLETAPSPSHAAVAPLEVTVLYVLLVVILIVDSCRHGFACPALISLMSGSRTRGSAQPIEPVASVPDRIDRWFTRAIALRSSGLQYCDPNVGLRNTDRNAE